MKMRIDAIDASKAQCRAKTDATAVREYAEAMKAGAIFPPVVAFREPGCQTFVCADGHHRIEAARAAGLDDISVSVHEGDETDALEFALQSNSQHGLRPTEQDRLAAVGRLMSCPALADKYKTNQDRADLLHVSLSTFQRLLAKWRDAKGGDHAERVAKAHARDQAEKKTRGDLKAADDVTVTSSGPQRNLSRDRSGDHGDGDLSRDKSPDARREKRGRGIELATEAVKLLAQIPLADPLREAGFDHVADWIDANRRKPAAANDDTPAVCKACDGAGCKWCRRAA